MNMEQGYVKKGGNEFQKGKKATNIVNSGLRIQHNTYFHE